MWPDFSVFSLEGRFDCISFVFAGAYLLIYKHISTLNISTCIGSGDGGVVKFLACGARGQGFKPGSRHFDFRDCASPTCTSKSRSEWKMLKRRKIIKINPTQHNTSISQCTYINNIIKRVFYLDVNIILKSDLINNTDNTRILGTEPSSVILRQKR